MAREDAQDALIKFVDSRIDELVVGAQSEIQTRMDQLENDMRTQMQRRANSIAVVIGAVFLSGMLLGLNAGIRDVNNQVINLQDRILAAQKIIRESSKALDAATADLVMKQGELTTAGQDFSGAKDRFDELSSQLETRIENVDEIVQELESVSP